MTMLLMLSKFAGTSSAALLMQRGVGVIRIPPTPVVSIIALSAYSSSRTAATSRRPDFGNSSSSNNQTRTSTRSLSFYPQQPSPDYGKRGGGGSLRAYPTYAVFGETCLLSVKMLTPMFRVAQNSNTLLLDSNRKGRILLEWTPRVANGKLSREKLRFGLSAEEVGLMLDQLPANIVEFSRRAVTPTLTSGAGATAGQQQSEFGTISTNTADVPDKVLRITPGEGGSVSFLIDHELNGVSVAPPPPPPPPPPVSDTGNPVYSATSTSTITGPLEVVAQLGEFAVIKELLRSSIPVLVGWNTMVEIAMQKSFENMQNNNNNQGGGGYGGGGGGEHTF